MKKIIITLVVIVLGAIGLYFTFFGSSVDIDVEDSSDLVEKDDNLDSEVQKAVDVDDSETLLGKSVDGTDITAFHYGSGDSEILFVGGIHGGYSWNTALVAFELMDYLEEEPEAIPENIKVTVVPVLNPDGLEKIVGTSLRFDSSDVTLSDEETIPGRLNSNGVDLNRNFDCDWKSKGVWRSAEVDGGSGVFSEPESKAIRDYIESNDVTAVVVWYSAVGGVFASNCHDGVLPETLEITNTYAEASGYKAYEEFDFYEITGDMVNWLAGENIPAISVLLTTHEDVEWTKNKKGIDALLQYYSN